jgi:hypothetical protein
MSITCKTTPHIKWSVGWMGDRLEGKLFRSNEMILKHTIVNILSSHMVRKYELAFAVKGCKKCRVEWILFIC